MAKSLTPEAQDLIFGVIDDFYLKNTGGGVSQLNGETYTLSGSTTELNARRLTVTGNNFASPLGAETGTFNRWGDGDIGTDFDQTYDSPFSYDFTANTYSLSAPFPVYTITVA